MEDEIRREYQRLTDRSRDFGPPNGQLRAFAVQTPEGPMSCLWTVVPERSAMDMARLWPVVPARGSDGN
jgi:hypothetical protein